VVETSTSVVLLNFLEVVMAFPSILTYRGTDLNTGLILAIDSKKHEEGVACSHSEVGIKTFYPFYTSD
jgi:hypothetical protein